MTDLDYGQFEALTFDCYGTLIDWEAGILTGLRRVARAGAPRVPATMSCSSALPRSRLGPRPGRTVCTARSWATACAVSRPRTASKSDDAEAAEFGDSVGEWPAFPDSAAALARLHERFQLGVITNCDDDLFARSARRLETDFDWVVTAQSVGSYKPNPRNSRARDRADRPSSRTGPARRPEPLPRPRPGKGVGPHHRLDRPAPRPTGHGRDAARRGDARRDVPRHGLVRRRGDGAADRT